MSEYLSKEEIKQWRSSLEKITLEEFAARLGKKIVHETSSDNDIIDMVFHGNPTVTSKEDNDWRISRTERLNAIAERSFEREREISATPFFVEQLAKDSDNKTLAKKDAGENPSVKQTEKTKTTTKKVLDKKVSAKKTTKAKAVNTMTKAKAKTKDKFQTPQDIELRQEVRIVLKKALTDREQKVFDYFSANSNKIVYAKDLAELLDLPRDYVYKYIKNLRAKIDGENLKNADKGGFILSV